MACIRATSVDIIEILPISLKTFSCKIHLLRNDLIEIRNTILLQLLYLTTCNNSFSGATHIGNTKLSFKNLLKPITDYNLALYGNQRLTFASKSPQNTKFLKDITVLSYLPVELP